MSTIKIAPSLQIDHDLLKAQKQELWRAIIELEMTNRPPADTKTRRIELLQGILMLMDVLDDECEETPVETLP